MMDDDLLVYRDDATRDRAMTRMKQLGVDYVRVTVLWSVVAEQARVHHGPAQRRFDPVKPSTYPVRNWDRYDRLVRAARTLGLGVYFNVTPPGPAWARGRAPKGLRVGRSSARGSRSPASSPSSSRRSGAGSRAATATRTTARQAIPRVDLLVAAQRAQPGRLAVAAVREGRMASPALARELFLRGRAALDRTGHGRDTILFGETAPLGSSLRNPTSPIRPKRFLREFLCQRAQRLPLQPVREVRAGSARPGIAHHPYTKNVSPTQRDRHPDAITMANIADLGRLVDRSPPARGRSPRGLPMYMTEFGFETNPPDPFSGVPLERQAEWNQLGELLAFDEPAHRLADAVPAARRRAGRERAAPLEGALVHLPVGPLLPGRHAEAGRDRLLLPVPRPRARAYWGQLRFRPNALPPGVQDSVQIQWQARAAAATG